GPGGSRIVVFAMGCRYSAAPAGSSAVATQVRDTNRDRASPAEILSALQRLLHRHQIRELSRTLLLLRLERLRHAAARDHAGLPQRDIVERIGGGVIARVVDHHLGARNRY